MNQCDMLNFPNTFVCGKISSQEHLSQGFLKCGHIGNYRDYHEYMNYRIHEFMNPSAPAHWNVILLQKILVSTTCCFPHSSVGKESVCNAGDPSSIPGSGKSIGEGIGYPLQYSWASPVAQLVKESTCNAGDLGSISGLGRSPGEGKGYPLQYSGLENSMDCTVQELDMTEWLSLHFTCCYLLFHFAPPSPPGKCLCLFAHQIKV